jgi:hypothetical protein
MFKARERATVVGHSKIVEAAAHLARHGLLEVGERLRVVLLTEPAIDRHQSASQSLLRGRALEPCLACPGPSPVVGKTQKALVGFQGRGLAQVVPPDFYQIPVG